MEIISLAQAPNLFEPTMQLIEQGLGYQRPHRFVLDCYSLVKKDNHHNLHVVLDKGTPMAHVGLLPKIMRVRGHSFPVNLIGGVVTQKKAQGLGYFKRLWSHVSKQSPPCLGHILWSDLDVFYGKYGFYQVGMVEVVGREGFFKPKHYRRTLYGELDSQEQQDIRFLHEQNTQELIALARDDQSWQDIEQVKSADIFVHTGHDGRIDRYFFVNKGRDLGGVVHEAFGDERANLLGDLKKSRLWLPGHPTSTNIIYSGLFKIGDVGIFQDFVKVVSFGEIVVEDITLKKVIFSFCGQTFQLSEEDFLRGLFGPDLIDDFKPFYRPLWFGGLDSI